MINKKRYLIAVDGGGTKTEFCIKDILQGRIFTKTYGSANYKSSNHIEARNSIRNGLESVLKEFKIKESQVIGIIYGIAGCDTKKDYKFYQNMISKINIKNQFLCNDSEMMMLANIKEGICVVAGTGSIAMGIDKKGNRCRAGGWGVPLSDEGSGWWIGYKALSAYLNWNDGVIPKESFFDNVSEKIKKEEGKISTEKITQLSISKVASYAKDIMDGAECGDVFCKQIVDEAAEKIAGIIYAVYKKMCFKDLKKIKILTMGSLFTSSDFRKTIKSKLTLNYGVTNAEFEHPNLSPAHYGIKLAEKIFIKQEGGYYE